FYWAILALSSKFSSTKLALGWLGVPPAPPPAPTMRPPLHALRHSLHRLRRSSAVTQSRPGARGRSEMVARPDGGRPHAGPRDLRLRTSLSLEPAEGARAGRTEPSASAAEPSDISRTTMPPPSESLSPKAMRSCFLEEGNARK
ncbi:hypothetical protein THAOC_20044, partial [Thalassiosira oceanica]